jgi:DNA repair exonuclease SbcCD ATPase subunit
MSAKENLSDALRGYAEWTPTSTSTPVYRDTLRAAADKIDELTSANERIKELETRLACARAAQKISIPTNTMEQEFQSYYRRGFEAGKRESSGPAAGGGDTPLGYRYLYPSPFGGQFWSCQGSERNGYRPIRAEPLYSQEQYESMKRQRDEAIARNKIMADSLNRRGKSIFPEFVELRNRAEAAERERDHKDAQHTKLYAQFDAALREAEALRKDAEKWRSHIAKNETWEKLFENAPCFVCGYNGPGYFQPDKHPCAKLYHEAIADVKEK